MKTNKLTRSALLASLMLALGYVESLLPAFSAIPGIKLGLANTVLLYAVYICGVAGAIAHNLGQCIAAACVIGISPVLAYFPMLLLSGAVTGLVTGTAAALVIKHMRPPKNKTEV